MRFPSTAPDIRALSLALGFSLLLGTGAAVAETELTLFRGHQFGSDIQLRSAALDSRGELDFKSGASIGLLINGDLEQAGKQYQLYYSRSELRARVEDGALFGGVQSFDAVIERLQFGGLYLPGGSASGGFAAGSLGVTRLAPKSPGLDTEYRPSIELSGGFKVMLTDHAMIRFDLRGLYADLESQGTVFCSGGCTARIESEGFFQVEASAGVTVRF